MAKKPTFQDVLNAAIKDLLECGFDSQKRLDMWLQRLEIAARDSLVPVAKLQSEMKDFLTLEYARATKDTVIFKKHPGISQYTLAAVKPKLRGELDRRILSGADLIKRNRSKAIADTLRRFEAWGTSIPIGGTRAESRKEASDSIKKGMSGLSFEDRRVIIDQGHKLTAAVSDIIAVDGGAIAMRWHHVKERSSAYTPRPEHERRDNVVYMIPNNWALKKGLVKLAGHKYTDQVTKPGEEVFCRCTGEYLYNLRDLPPEMITSKGKEELERVREHIARLKYA